ncbi:MAG: hypothetical protein QOI65_2306 [Thermoleophilaceae bacterium]|nr:hypothetical protein [Thermoleophilaceae bacterium]
MEPSRSTRRALLLLIPVLVAGVAAGLWTFSSRGDAAFVLDQEHPSTASDRELEALVSQPLEPTPTGPGARAKTARCVPGSSRGLRNPWTCTVRYASGHRLRYRVTVRRDGHYVGQDPTGQFIIRGCCAGSLGGAAAG